MRKSSMIEKSARIRPVLMISSICSDLRSFQSLAIPTMISMMRMEHRISLEAMQKATARQYFRFRSSISLLALRMTTSSKLMRQMTIITISTKRIRIVLVSVIQLTEECDGKDMHRIIGNYNIIKGLSHATLRFNIDELKMWQVVEKRGNN